MPDVTRTVVITADDIKVGRPKQCTLCPGALAVKRAFPETIYVDVMQEEILIALSVRPDQKGPYPTERVEAPSILQKFVSDFDNKLPVEPIAFDLTFNLPEVPPCSLPLLPS